MLKTIRKQRGRKRCSALTKHGEQCRNLADPQCDPFCYLHCDPEPTGELNKVWRVVKVASGIGSGLATIVKIIEWVTHHWPMSYVDHRVIKLRQQASMYIHLAKHKELPEAAIETLAEGFVRDAEAWFAELPRDVRTKAISMVKTETEQRYLSIEEE